MRYKKHLLEVESRDLADDEGNLSVLLFLETLRSDGYHGAAAAVTRQIRSRTRTRRCIVPLKVDYRI